MSNKFCILFGLVAALSWLVGLAPDASAQQQIQLYFGNDEAEFQSVNGLTVQGVTFGFTVDDAASAEAFYASYGPGTLTYVDDPSLTGTSDGRLAMSFGIPTSTVEFGVALSSGAPLTPGLQVVLRGSAGELIETISVDTAATDSLGFSEAFFQYQGEPVTEVELGFMLAQGSFAVDNLVYNVPEPSSNILLLGLLVPLIRRRKRQPIATVAGRNASAP